MLGLVVMHERGCGVERREGVGWRGGREGFVSIKYLLSLVRERKQFEGREGSLVGCGK